MSHSVNESGDGMFPGDDQTNSPLVDDSSSGVIANGEVVFKKGQWTSAEDAILLDYVKKHGERNWGAVQKYSGLFRCGKSCRLRWANHLRPNLKKGAFSPDEERLIIELHAKLGNKWAQMAAHLPGRTDNDIKNYWNTRMKRRQRAPLPLYPPEVFLQDNQCNQNACASHGDGQGHHDLWQSNSYAIPDVRLDSLKANQNVLPSLLNVSAGNMLMKGMGSSRSYSFMSPTIRQQKRLQESMLTSSEYSGVENKLPLFSQTEDANCQKRVFQSFDFSLHPDPDNKKVQESEVNQSSHSHLNGDFSASKPVYGTVKLELPSLQYPESDLGSWGSPAPAPVLESVDAFIKSPSPVPDQSECLSPRNSGLLDASLHEAKTLSTANNQLSDKSSNSSTVALADVAEGTARIVSSTKCKDFCDCISPLGNSMSARACYLDEKPPAVNCFGFVANSEPDDQAWTFDIEKETSVIQDLSRPDALLVSCWLEHNAAYTKEQGMTDAVAALLCHDLGNDLKCMVAGTSMPSPKWGFGSCTWNNMPAVCQMSEFPECYSFFS